MKAWLLKNVFGKRYFIKEVDWLRKDEIIVFWHYIYIGKTSKKSSRKKTKVVKPYKNTTSLNDKSQVYS